VEDGERVRDREGEMKLKRNMDALGIKLRGTIIDGRSPEGGDKQALIFV
jgi:hypothetical protein